MLGLVASVETQSEHPVAQAIVAGALSREAVLYAATDFCAKPGLGVEAMVDGCKVQVGADRYMLQLGLDIAPFAEIAKRLGDDANLCQMAKWMPSRHCNTRNKQTSNA